MYIKQPSSVSGVMCVCARARELESSSLCLTPLGIYDMVHIVYGCEIWAVNKSDKKRVKALEMWIFTETL